MLEGLTVDKTQALEKLSNENNKILTDKIQVIDGITIDKIPFERFTTDNIQALELVRNENKKILTEKIQVLEELTIDKTQSL